MSGLKVIALLLLAVGLYYNYRTDQGQHRRAKVWQAVCLGLLVQAYASTFGLVSWLVGNWRMAQQKFSRDVGYVPGEVQWLLYLLHTGLALLTLLTAIRMVSRSDAARRRLLWLLPPLAVVETFSFYRGWLGNGYEAPLVHGFAFLLGLAFNGGVALALTLVYRSRFMKAFYQPAPVAAEPVALTSEQP